MRILLRVILLFAFFTAQIGHAGDSSGQGLQDLGHAMGEAASEAMFKVAMLAGKACKDSTYEIAYLLARDEVGVIKPALKKQAALLHRQLTIKCWRQVATALNKVADQAQKNSTMTE